MNGRLRLRHAAVPRPTSSQQGLTMIEFLVGIAIMAVVASTIAILVGTVTHSKMINGTRLAGTEAARATLAWMAERLRNAGLNLQPSAQAEPRCMDRVVAQEALLLPTAHAVYVSGEMQKTDTVAGDEVLTIGYYVAPDPDTGNRVVMEYKQPCASGPTSIPKYSARLSNPKLNITDLTFQYYDASGTAITSPIGPMQIRKIASVKISLTVQSSDGTSGTQAQTLSRSTLFWNPEPNANNWIDANENY